MTIKRLSRTLPTHINRSGNEFAKSSTGLTAYGSSSLFTTVEDLSKWVINFDKQIASKNPVYTRMLEDGVLNNGDKVGYGYGLGFGVEGELKTVSHTGGWAGYRTVIMNFPEEKFSCIILSNAADFNSYGSSLDVAKLFLKEKFKTKDKTTDSIKDMPTADSGYYRREKSHRDVSAGRWMVCYDHIRKWSINDTGKRRGQISNEGKV